MSYENQWQSCKKCNKDMRFEFSIRDEIWEKLPTKWQDHVLCIECFLEELDKVEIDQKLNSSDFAFMVIIGDHLLGTLIDRNP